MALKDKVQICPKSKPIYNMRILSQLSFNGDYNNGLIKGEHQLEISHKPGYLFTNMA